MSAVEFGFRLTDEAVDRIADALAPKLAQLLERSSTTNPANEWMDARQAAAYLGFNDVNALDKLTGTGAIAYSQDAPACKRWFRRRDLDEYRERNLQPALSELSRNV